jgi:LPS export ABC transporter protein LptC
MRRQKIRLILLIAISASLGGVAYKVAETIWVMKARELKNNPAKVLDFLPEAALQIKDFHRAHIEGEKKVWEVFGDEARYLKADKQLIIQKARIWFYQKDNTTVEATGKEARVWLADEERGIEKAKLEGDVRVNYRGYVLNTNEALYIKSKNQIFLPGRVSVKGDGMELEGVEMEISLDTERMRLHKNVKTKVQPDRLEKMRGPSDEKKQS